MILDRATILAVSALISIVLGAILMAAQANGRIGSWATSWGGGTLLFGLSNCSPAVQGLLPDPLLTALNNIAGIIGHALIVQGARLLAGRAPHWRRLTTILVVISIPLAIATIPEDRAFRVAYNNIAFIVGDVWVAFEAMRMARRERVGSAWIMVALFAVTVPFSCARLVIATEAMLGLEALDHARVGTWLAALVAAVWSIRGAVPALILAERTTQKLSRLAFHDPLTGALNRAGLDRLRPSLMGPVAIVLIDLDHFKTLNDRYGHARGDAVLRLLADSVMRDQRAGQAFVRLGGDEFMLLLPQATIDAAERAAEAVRAGFTLTLRPLGIAAPLPTLSMGVAAASLADGAALDALISEADAALYRAKQAGRDRVAGALLAA